MFLFLIIENLSLEIYLCFNLFMKNKLYDILLFRK